MGRDGSTGGPRQAGALAAIAVLAGAAVWLGASGRTAAQEDRRVAGPSASAGSVIVSPRRSSLPNADLGALEVQVKVTRQQVGFDYEQAAVIAREYAAPEDAKALVARARAAVAERRRQARVPTYGAVPPPASYAMTPIAYTLDELAPGLCAVNLLSYVTLTTADGRIKDGLYVGTQLVSWIDGGWRLVMGTGQDINRLMRAGQPPAVAPHSPRFAQAGWQLLGEVAR